MMVMRKLATAETTRECIYAQPMARITALVSRSCRKPSKAVMVVEKKSGGAEGGARRPRLPDTARNWVK
jgi:hypothetical protein